MQKIDFPGYDNQLRSMKQSVCVGSDEKKTLKEAYMQGTWGVYQEEKMLAKGKETTLDCQESMVLWCCEN